MDLRTFEKRNMIHSSLYEVVLILSLLIVISRSPRYLCVFLFDIYIKKKKHEQITFLTYKSYVSLFNSQRHALYPITF
jgi:hypothetical protein